MAAVTDTDGPTRDVDGYRDNLPEVGQIAATPILIFFGDELRRELEARRRAAAAMPPAEAKR